MIVQLDQREQAIIEYILDVDTYVTAKELAERFDVSVRSIKYDIENIKEWLKQREVQLISKTSKGYCLDIPSEKRRELNTVSKTETTPDHDIRIKNMLFKLLLVDEYISAQKIADSLGVSKNTIVSDLPDVSESLSNYELSLERRSGYGLRITGEEKKCRNLMEVLLQNELSEYDIYQIMNRLTSAGEPFQGELYQGKEPSFFKIFQVGVEQLADLLTNPELNQLNYAELLTLAFRAAIAVSRMLLNKTVGSYKMLSNQQELLDRGDLTFQLMQNIFQIYELPLFEDEYAYLYSDFVDSDDQQDIVQETRAIIRCVSKKLAIDFTTDSQLFTNLFAHLSLRLGKKRVFANEYNPFVDDIKSEHRDLFAAIEEACKVIITGNPNLINDSFIAYIALHFLVFFERKEKENQAVHIVYICSTGLGVTSLIQQTVMEEIPNIEKVDFASILDANKTIKEKKPDIVVSIFPLEDINLPFVKVHALLTKEDIQAIKDAINNISKKSNTVKRKNKTLTQRNFQELKDVSQDLIVKGFVVYQSLIGVFRNNISNELKEAFLLHVFLMVQRIYFDGQYADEGHFNKEDFKERKADLQQIEKIFAENELSVNQAEIIALLQYINGGEETYGALNEGCRENH